jgi:hypothetical protein
VVRLGNSNEPLAKYLINKGGYCTTLFTITEKSQLVERYFFSCHYNILLSELYLDRWKDV